MRTKAQQVIDRSLSEDDFQRKVIDYAQLRRWRVYHTWKSIHSPSGFPDLVLVRRDQVIFAELKKQSGYPTKAQAEWLQTLHAVEKATCGCVRAYLWRPSDWPEIEVLLG